MARGRSARHYGRIRFSESSFALEDEEGRALWSTTDGTAFLAAILGRLDWTDTTGHFSFQRTLEQTFGDQSVESVETGQNWAELSGHLFEDDTANLPYTLTLRSTGRRRVEVGFDVPGAYAVLLRFDRQPDEGVHGLGVQFTDFDLAGRYIGGHT